MTGEKSASHVLSFEQEVTYDCQLGCHMGSNGSRKNLNQNVVDRLSSEVECCVHFEPLEFHCLHGLFFGWNREPCAVDCIWNL